jgi:3-oxoacyl-[acyl-carrier-protein] synthase-1
LEKEKRIVMKPVYIAADNIFSPLGISTEENFEKVKRGESAIRAITNPSLSAEPFYASLFDKSFFSKEENDLTRFEKICVASIQDALSKTEIKLSDANTLFILSTTKGNIELIETNRMNEELRKRVSLFTAAKNIAASFGAVNKPVVVSNACISGVLSVIIAKRLLQSGKYKHAVITGADVLSRFIISGFQSLHAMSAKPCRPFDKQRDGINLGECASTIILTTEKALSKGVVVGGGASSNDANHISGPSRTGLELSYAVQSAMKDSDVSAKDLSFISAHGTATTYNDEMEAKAFTHAGLNDIPLHSLKGHFGHTLGAAGVLESILSYRSLKEGIVLPSKNFEELGVSEKVKVNKNLSKSNKTHASKTASGFGGCNAAVIYSIQ